MSGLGKRILSAFVEVTEENPSVPEAVKEPAPTTIASSSNSTTAEENSKFKQYFEKLFFEANIPGPDYFEFSKMIEAMNSIPDEKARYSAAFAGLNVQGLDKQKLLSTATEYIKILQTDAAHFSATVEATLQEKVHGKKTEIEQKSNRIQQLSKEINELHQQIATLSEEIKENEAKIESSFGGYKRENDHLVTKIQQDIEKIKAYVH